MKIVGFAQSKFNVTKTILRVVSFITTNWHPKRPTDMCHYPAQMRPTCCKSDRCRHRGLSEQVYRAAMEASDIIIEG